jgi:hypothetical protein
MGGLLAFQKSISLYLTLCKATPGPVDPVCGLRCS